MPQDKPPAGRGFYGLSKGAQVTDLTTLQVGDVILKYSRQFHAENTLKVVKIRPDPVLRIDTVYWDPVNGCRIGREEMSVCAADMAHGTDRYYRPAPAPAYRIPAHLGENAAKQYKFIRDLYEAAPDHARRGLFKTVKDNVTKGYLLDPDMKAAAEAFINNINNNI